MAVSPSYRKQSIDLLCKSIDWFLYECNTYIRSILEAKFGVDSLDLLRKLVHLLIFFFFHPGLQNTYPHLNFFNVISIIWDYSCVVLIFQVCFSHHKNPWKLSRVMYLFIYFFCSIIVFFGDVLLFFLFMNMSMKHRLTHWKNSVLLKMVFGSFQLLS